MEVNFSEALSAVFNDGDRVTRAHWNNRRIYVDTVDAQLVIIGFASAGTDDGLPHPWVVTEQDYFADDWEVVTDG
jgi:hypothetical protein